MADYEFIPPDFLIGNTAEEIQERMMSGLPEDIDNMPGGFPYDFTMPTAIEKAEIINFFIPRMLMIMFPQYAWGEWLDKHGAGLGLERRKASHASGYVQISGEDGTLIPEGSVFCVPSSGDDAAIEYHTEENVIITDGTANVPVNAILPGAISNVAAKTISLALKPIKGVTGITNAGPITGGGAEESDDVFRGRIMDACFAKGTNFVGNTSDYRRWAMEVPGVGSATVIPTWDGPGTVKIVVIDVSGQPANERILQAIYDNIMAPDNQLERKAPVGVELSVVCPAINTINYSAVLTLEKDTSMEEVKVSFSASISRYYNEIINDGYLRYTKAAAILSEIPGVVDYKAFAINGENKNIELTLSVYPVTGQVDFVEDNGR